MVEFWPLDQLDGRKCPLLHECSPTDVDHHAGLRYSPPAGTDMLPDVNTIIRRDQKRTFTSAYLRPMRGSSRQFMMFGASFAGKLVSSF